MATFHIKEELIVILRSLAGQHEISHRVQLTEMLELTHPNQENRYILTLKFAILTSHCLPGIWFFLGIILELHFTSALPC